MTYSTVQYSTVQYSLVPGDGVKHYEAGAVIRVTFPPRTGPSRALGHRAGRLVIRAVARAGPVISDRQDVDCGHCALV